MQATGTDAGRRTAPQQVRSGKMVERILDSAAALFAERGIEAVTTNHIADHAGVAVGSLYRYFTDKDAILAGLADRHVAGLSSIFEHVVVDDPALELPELLDRALVPLVAYQVDHPDLAVVLGYGVGHDLPGVRHMYEFLVDAVGVVVAAWVPGVPKVERETTAIAIVGIARALLFEAPVRDERERKRLIRELKYVLEAYINAKYPGPDDPVWAQPDPRPAPRRAARA